MKKLISDKPKPVGRPATGRDKMYGARFPESEIAEIDVWAKGNDTSRSEAIRRLVKLGLTVRAK